MTTPQGLQRPVPPAVAVGRTELGVLPALVRIEGARHLRTEDRPEAVADALTTFLR